jgi:hypothetical protein
MTRRFPMLGLALVVALATVIGVFAFRPVSANAATNEAPREIDAHQYVGFHLTALPANGVITETFYGPGGTKFYRRGADGNPVRGLVATGAGNLDVAISPYYDLKSVAPGNWWAQYCVENTGPCWNFGFKVLG